MSFPAWILWLWSLSIEYVFCCRVGEQGGGWHTIRLQTRRSLDELPREGNLVVLTLGRPPQGNPIDFVTRFGSNGRGCAH